MPSSYNGWPADPDPSAIGVVKFGDPQGFPFPGGVKGGDVATVQGEREQPESTVLPRVGDGD
jgi:hypothetical protein